MKNLLSKVKDVSFGLGLVIYLIPSIFPSVYTGTKIDGDKISITKRKGLFSKVSYETSKDENEISIYNFNIFSSDGLINLRDYNKDNIVDEIYFSDDLLTKNPLTIERPKKGESLNSELFQEADKIYKEEISKFKEN